MGRVFSWDDVSCNNIPTLEAFQEVFAGVKSRIQSESSIVAAIACGSVARSDHNVRSDLDVVVIYDHENAELANTWMRSEHRMAAKLHVPLSFLPCDVSIARTRMHHLGGSFVRHLQRSVEHGGNLKGDVFVHLSPSQSEEEELESYLRVKYYKLMHQWVEAVEFTPEREAGFLQKVLEAPMHVARKVLAHQGWMEGDSKTEILSQYSSRMPEELADELRRLVRLDACYTTKLHEQLHERDRETYTTCLFVLRQYPPTVIEFVRRNLLFITKATRT